jgi:terminal uridylyltransferase
MVLYYLVHVKQPPVLPNLQRIAPLTPLSEDQIMLDGRNIYFFDDVETLRKEWSSINFETVGELSAALPSSSQWPKLTRQAHRLFPFLLS